MPASWLKIPHRLQTTDGACLQACCRMLLAHLQKPVTESQLSDLFEAEEFGTPASRVLRLEQWGYRVTYGPTDLEQLQAWLRQELAPIAFIQTGFLDYWPTAVQHAVVVVGLDEEQVYLNDPAFETAPQIASLDGFLAAWIEMDETAATISLDS